MTSINFLGACKDVGGSGYLIKSGNRNILLDYGVYLRRENPFPITVSPKDVDAIFLSHAHLDHSGSLPLMYITGNPPLYMTKITLDLIIVLLEDFIKISETILPFEEDELYSIKENTVKINYGDKIKLGEDFEIDILDAGHIPGSMMILVKANGKNILYTGDVNINDTLLLNGAKIDLPPIDYIITESTYALKEHPPREQLEKEFIEKIINTIENDGSVLIPAFAISRSQEILCILEKYDINYQIYLDGMARKVSRIFLKYPKFFRDYGLLSKAHRDIDFVRNRRQRDKILNENSVIIAPAGMLNGGAALFYANQIRDNPKNSIFLVGYQVPGSPGRMLLDENKLKLNGGSYKVNSKIDYFDFSSHSGSKDLLKMIEKLPGNPTVITVHGEPEACQELADRVKNEIGLKTFTPNAGDSIDI
jgi:putative mRNA 3-end processing factor